MNKNFKVGQKIGVYVHQDDDNGWLLYGVIKRDGNNYFIRIEDEDLPFTDDFQERTEEVNADLKDVITDATIWVAMTLHEYENVGLEDDEDFEDDEEDEDFEDDES